MLEVTDTFAISVHSLGTPLCSAITSVASVTVATMMAILVYVVCPSVELDYLAYAGETT